MKLHKIPFRICEIEGGGSHILIKANINKVKSNLLIDTGASNSVFDLGSKAFKDNKTLESQSDIRSSGFNSAIENLHIGAIESFSISYFRTSFDYAIFTPLDHINNLYKSMNLPRISGIIGCDFLIKHNAIIDFQQKILQIEKK
ncbi:MAG: hypothetical protein JXR36_15770 [Bacteroidales bacterium]|nr:hypothetical protein [Bacteroidales bacterium]